MFYTVHSAKSHVALSAPLASYTDALRWVREFNATASDDKAIALKIVRHTGTPTSPVYHFDQE